MKTPAPSPPRVDWPALRARVDIIDAASRLFGRPPDARRGRVALWRCPWHDDHDPSLVVDPERGRWRCWPCGIGGDVVDLARRVQGVGFREAVAFLTGGSPPSRTPPGRPVAEPATPAPRKPTGLPEAAAVELVEAAAARLWSPEGVAALAYLTGPRCLTEATSRAARLGWVPAGTPGVPWKAPGILIPWFDADRPTLLKLRPPDAWRASLPEDRRPPKYLEVWRRPGATLVFPSPQVIRPGRPLVIVEGEFDALLVGQALRGRAPVVTLGSASARPEGSTLNALLVAPQWFIATDADPAGDGAAAGWPSRARRVRPPGPYKDWGEAAAGGVGLARWWSDVLEGTTNPRLFTWEELASWRWAGSTDDDVNIERGG